MITMDWHRNSTELTPNHELRSLWSLPDVNSPSDAIDGNCASDETHGTRAPHIALQHSTDEGSRHALPIRGDNSAPETLDQSRQSCRIRPQGQACQRIWVLPSLGPPHEAWLVESPRSQLRSEREILLLASSPLSLIHLDSDEVGGIIVI